MCPRILLPAFAILEKIRTKKSYVQVDMNNCLKWISVFWLSAWATSALSARDEPELDRLHDRLALIAKRGEVIGLQVAVRDSEKVLFSRGYGNVAAESEKPVDRETLFLIGSCSKPFATACLLSLIGDNEVVINLDDEIDRWLPDFTSPALKEGGNASRAPTVEELMAHRAGIYSQKMEMTRTQVRWIRDFTITLEQSVQGIKQSPLIARPGTLYAYSGAGYCVLGRVAERAAGKPFESILQERVCNPLGLSRTTYFPAGRFPDHEIATGVPRQASPHLLDEKHKLPLIGGSLYSTAEEMTRFGVGILEGWNGSSEGDQLRVPTKLIKELGIARSQKSGYGLGWKVVKRNGKAIRLAHSGALYSHRAWMVLDLEKGISISGCWTISGRERQPAIAKVLQQYLISE